MTTAARPLLSQPPSFLFCRICLLQRPRRLSIPPDLIHRQPQPQQQHHRRTISTYDRKTRLKRVASESGQTADDNAEAMPRWQRTPQAMAAPYRLRPRNDNDEYACNEDQAVLDGFYSQMLGRGGDKLLEEEVKWLAVTHKSFDHGRRGFNDRLAFVGKRLVELQTSLAMLDAPTRNQQSHEHNNTALEATEMTETEEQEELDSYGRTPFTHPSLQGLSNLTERTKQQVLDKARLAQLAEMYRIGDVLRWKPRQVKNLKSSGLDTVMAHTLYAIMGAIALQRGGEVANETIRSKILSPLGL